MRMITLVLLGFAAMAIIGGIWWVTGFRLGTGLPAAAIVILFIVGLIAVMRAAARRRTPS